MAKKSRPTSRRTVARSAISGRFVKRATAKARPRTTVVERVRKGKK